MELEVLYYSNGQGGTAISVDGGEHVVVRTGRRLLLVHTMWEEGDEEDAGPLSEEQLDAIDEAKAEIVAMTETQQGVSEIVLAYRKRRLRQDQIDHVHRPENRVRKLPDSVTVQSSDLIDD